MKIYWKMLGIIILFLVLTAVIGGVLLSGKGSISADNPWKGVNKSRDHIDHSPFFSKALIKPQEVTRACLECHPQAAKDFMKTTHWNWEGHPVKVPGHDEPFKIGKKNLINNYCIGIKGNWISCNKCHAGFGWKDENFDFTNSDNVDCLVCHDWSGLYMKGDYGIPTEDVDLLVVARSVGYPKRDNCGFCHNNGGGGMGVKHGDLDNSLLNPNVEDDVHMGRAQLLCIDCHITEKHDITGQAYSVSIDQSNGISCENCHNEAPHVVERLNQHTMSVACQTCHIPEYAREVPTKTFWDWSKAGDGSRKENPHHYLKIKGEFVYEQNLIPEYYWFNLTSKRYILGDKIDPSRGTWINPPLGDIKDGDAKIWPFKIHRAVQPYDTVNNYLVQPVTSGEGGYWTEFDWDKALRLGAGFTGIPFSGEYGFTNTIMHWPISHMVVPSRKALSCLDCHSDSGRMDWKSLGYEKDPMKAGSRKIDKIAKEGGNNEK